MTGSAFLGLFFVGLLNMVRIVEDPFGEDLDDLNPDALLWSTETTLQVCHSAFPSPAQSSLVLTSSGRPETVLQVLPPTSSLGKGLFIRSDKGPSLEVTRARH